jgi:Mg2+-importing ATPase
MLYFFNATEPVFQTAWFIESLCTQTLVIFIIRTRRIPFFKSKPSKWLILSSLAVVAVALVLPFTLIGDAFDFIEPPVIFLAILAVFAVSYLALVEVVKMVFYRKHAMSLEQTQGIR